MVQKEYSLMFKDEVEVVERVLRKFTPMLVNIDTPREALTWYDYLNQCGWTEDKYKALVYLRNYISINLPG